MVHTSKSAKEYSVTSHLTLVSQPRGFLPHRQPTASISVCFQGCFVHTQVGRRAFVCLLVRECVSPSLLRQRDRSVSSALYVLLRQLYTVSVPFPPRTPPLRTLCVSPDSSVCVRLFQKHE